LPVDWVILVLKEVGAGLVGEAISVHVSPTPQQAKSAHPILNALYMRFHPPFGKEQAA
jgi:hypothetical protein